MNSEDVLRKFIDATGLTEERANLFLQKANGDLNRALELYKSSAKNIAVVFGTFSGNNSKYSGVYFLAFNVEKERSERISIIISYSKGMLLDFEIDEWDSFEEKVYNKKIEGTYVIENMSNETEKFFEKMINNTNLKPRFFDVIRNNQRKQLEAIINDLFSKAIGDISVDLHMKYLMLSEVEFNKEDFLGAGGSEAGDVEQVSEAGAAAPAVEKRILKTEFVISPISGKLVKELQVGDVVYTKIVDSQDITTQFLESFGAYRDGQFVPVEATVEDIKYNEESERFEIVVKLADNIYGKTVLAPSVKVKTKTIAGEALLSMEESPTLTDKLSVYMIVGGIAVIIIVILVVLYLIYGLF